MSADTPKETAGAAYFSDDVISAVVSMMESATEREVREALRHVHRPGGDTSGDDPALRTVAQEERAGTHCAGRDDHGSGATCFKSHLAVCEFAERRAGPEAEAREHHVLATHDLMRVLQGQTETPATVYESASHGKGKAATSLAVAPTNRTTMTTSLASSPSMEMVCCILILLRRHSGKSMAAAGEGPLTLRHVNVYAVDINQPLEGLLVLLQSVYEPILRSQREIALRSKMQDFISSIRSRCQALAEVDVKRFVHVDLLELCMAYPAADVQQLVDILGPGRCTDSNFLRYVLSVRNMCRGVLEAKFEGGDIASARDEVAYWQAVLCWLEQVERQLHSREWRLVHRLLGHRVETSYELEFKIQAQLVRDYLSHLRTVPFHKIDGVETANYAALVGELFDAMTRPTRYPPHQSLRLLESIVREIAGRFVELMAEKNVLRVDTPEARLQCLRETICAMQDLHRRYMQTAELFYSQRHVSAATAPTPSSLSQQKYHHLILLRAQELWVFVNEHFHYERTLQQIFLCGSLEASATSSFYKEVRGAYDKFTAATMASRCLWNVSDWGTAEFQRALAAHERRLASIDERLALLVGTMLTSAQEMSGSNNDNNSLLPTCAEDTSTVTWGMGYGSSLYRIYSRFRPLRREKVQAVVMGFRMALLEQLNREMREVRERYFDIDSARDAVRLAVARFGVTPVVGRILWEHSVQKGIEACLVRHDAIHEHGWHELLCLRTIEHRWWLGEPLARFFGVALDDLLTKELTAWSEVHGTAYALAYLDLVHAKDAAEWSSDPHIHTAQQFVQENDASAIGYARSRLVILRVGHGRGAQQHEVRDARSFCDTIAQRLQERVVEWCEDVLRRIALLDVSPTTMKLKGLLWQVVELQGGISDNCNYNSAHNNNKKVGHGSGNGGIKRTVVPNIPFDMRAVLQDMHMLDSMRLLANHTQLVADVRSFFRNNEENFCTANCLMELIRVFWTAISGDEELMAHLATEEYTNVHQSFLDGARLRWLDEKRVVKFMQKFSERVYAFCTAAARVREITTEIEEDIARLRGRGTYKAEAVVACMSKMCTLVKHLYSHSANAGWWVRRVQPSLDAAIVCQLEEHFRRWTEEFVSMGRDTRFLDKSTATAQFRLKPLRVRMRVIFKEIALSIPAAACRNYWINELNRCFAWVYTTPTLPQDHQPQQVGPQPLASQKQQQQQPHQALPLLQSTSTYGALLERFGSHMLLEPLRAIEKTVQDTIEVETQWRRGQQLLNIEVSVLQQHLGDDLEKWVAVLQHIRDMATGLMDFTQPSTLVGGIIIVANDAQKELGRKLDKMTQHIHLRYRDVVEKLLEACYRRIMEERMTVESYNVINDLGAAAQFLCDLLDIKEKVQEIERQLVALEPAEEYLNRQGFALPDSWIYVRKVKAEFGIYCELLDRKVKALELRRPFLRDDIKAQGDTFRSEVDELESCFHAIVKQVQPQQQRPEQAYLEEVSESLQQHFSDVQEKAQQLSERKKRLTRLRSALGLPPLVEEKLEGLLTRMEELQWVCGHVAGAYQRLRALGQTPFFEMVPQQLHEGLLAVEQEVREFPEDVRSHQAYVSLLNCIEKRLACRRLMHELRSDVMTPLERAERHWVTLKSQLQAPWRLWELTVADIWHSDPEENAKIYNDVLEFAQGEFRLELQLNQIIGFWNNFEFNTMIYRDQLLLIRGWDVVFERLCDDFDSFQGVRSSPFFSSQHIITLVTDWDNRLHLLRQVLEVLMAVQRRWVHLESIFGGNADISRQMPNDAAQFDRSSREFVNLMSATAGFGAAPVLKAQDFLRDKKLLATLERLEGQLSRVQRALSAYLDMQRRQFPRMFFVGDDDLLEIIGNSGNPSIVERHLPKMFTALTHFITDDGSSLSAATRIVGFASVEGEKVSMVRPVALEERPLPVWLTEVESSMAASLRQLTVSAVASLTSAGKVTPEWILSFPLQVVCLAFQVWWVRLQEETFAMWQNKGKKPNAKRETSTAVAHMVTLLDRLALDVISPNVTRALRHAVEELINLAVYQRDVSRVIELKRIFSADEFEWLRVLRLYLSDSGAEMYCRMADASFCHGFEYLGWYKRLVQTVLTDRCYLTLTQALHTRLGGSPVGPAGSGKTETVKALGTQLGRHVLVFNCDDTFDFEAMGRIFIGLCQVGAWGCFDEFNRLEERVLSAVSQQIQTIQEALRAQSTTVRLARQTVPLRETMALFITMNPGFAGRSNLPSNVKQLFRTMTMAAPDRETIAEVMLFAQGFRTAEALSRKIVPLFNLCSERLSKQAHYDFGLRALKSVLVTAGDLRRASHGDVGATDDAKNSVHSATPEGVDSAECDIVLRSLVISITPRLVTEDVALFYPLLRDFFPGFSLPDTTVTALRVAVEEVCRTNHYVPTPAWVEKVFQLYHTRKMRHGVMLVGPSGSGKTSCWKTLLRAMARVPLVDDDDDHDDDDDGGGGGDGDEGSNYNSTNRSVRRHRGGRGGCGLPDVHAYVIDPKAMSKAELFGVFEATTREWKDGVFVSILRHIINSEREDSRTRRQHWIVFDGDVDPLWVENFNSLLDDNKVYTLPNGERFSLPRSARIVFEVQDLRYATPATVSRCGMVWFSRGTVPISSAINRGLGVFYRTPVIDSCGRRRVISPGENSGGPKSRSGGNRFIVLRGTMMEHCEAPLDATMASQTTVGINGDESLSVGGSFILSVSGSFATGSNFVLREPSAREANVERDVLQLQIMMANVWAPAFAKGGLIECAVELIHNKRYWTEGIMEHNDLQMLHGVHLLLVDGIFRMWELRKQQVKFLSTDVLQKYAVKVLQHAVFWGLGASLAHEHREQLGRDLVLLLRSSFAFFVTEDMPDGLTLLDVEPNPENGGWRAIREHVTKIVIHADQVRSNNMIIPTIDTCRHEKILQAWINGGNATLLCGPPGSGKTMLITSILRRCAEYDAMFLNFSSETKPTNVIRALEQYCSVQNTVHGLVMSPSSGKRLLLFCDEINLPAMDPYGTQPVIQLLRQLIERGGYYRSRDNAWVTVEGVQVIGACNPPTDTGRVSLSHRFLRLAPVLFVNFPTKESLCVIYTSYCSAILAFNFKLQQTCAQQLAYAMVDMYTATQAYLTPWQQPHYVYSPRDLSRWTRAVYNGIMTWNDSERLALDVEGLVRLAVHEGLRVFQDRLVEQKEREWTSATIIQCFLSHFGETISAASPSLKLPVLYSTVLNRSYSESSQDALRAYIERKLEVFCEEEVNARLVVYDEMVDHVTRINRILQQPMGHMLLSGSSGVGKTIISRFVAWMNGMTVFRLSVHRNYQLDDYERDLRDILRRAGCKLERICFIFDDSNIMEASFLEYMNALLASGEVPGLFDGEEWGKLMEELRGSVVGQQALNMSGKPQKMAQQHERQAVFLPASNAANNSRHDGGGTVELTQQEALDTMASAMYVDTTSEQELYRWFIRNVKHNLHVIFTINPSSGEFASCAVASPALFNRCTIDWFGDWDRRTRYQIARQLTQDIDVMFCFERSSQQSEGEARDALADALCGIHEITGEVNRVVRLKNAHQGTFITPRHFTDCVRQLLRIYEEKKSGSKERLEHLRSGLAKLDAASEDVEEKRAKLREHEIVLENSNTKAQQMLDRIVTDTETTKREKQASERLRQQLREEEEMILADKASVQQQLSEVEPALQEAGVELSRIKPEYLREIRAYTTPPRMVKRVLEAVLVVMGEKEVDEWDVIKHHIRREDFLACVRAFEPRGITKEAYVTVQAMLREEGFTYEAAMRASKAAGPLLHWVKAQTNYAGILASMEPLHTRIEQLTAAYDTKRKHLACTESAIATMEASLVDLKKEYQEMTEKMANIKHEMNGVSARCKRAQTLLQQLLDERERWGAEMMGFNTEVHTALGDCTLAAASLAYFGYFDERTRKSVLFPRWRHCLRQLQISFCEKLRNAVEYLVTPQERLLWEKHGLPKDHLCVENAMILSRCQQYPFLIDPNGVAVNFLLQKHATEKINTTSFSKTGYLKQLDMAVRFGYPILMQDAEFFDPALDLLINHEVHCVRGHAVTRLGAQDVEIAATFRLFLVTRDSHYQPLPGMAGKVCLVNFTVTQSSLQSQCRHRLMLYEHPELDARRAHILRAQGEYQLRLRVVEQELLTSIARSEGSLLENDALTNALEGLKEKTKLLKDDIAEGDASMQAITAVETQYEPLAATLARMYFAMRRFSQLHRLYQYNVGFIFRLLADALAELPPRSAGMSGVDEREEDAARLQALTRHVFNFAHHRMRRGMFAQDHLVLAIILGKLRSGIKDPVGRQVTLEEWAWFEDALHSPSKNTASDNDAVSNHHNSDSFGIPDVLRKCGVCMPLSEVAFAELLRRPQFAAVRASLLNPQDAAAWHVYFLSPAPYSEVMPAFKRHEDDSQNTDTNEADSSLSVECTRHAFIAALLLFYTRRDAFPQAAYEFVRRFFDGSQKNIASSKNNGGGRSFFSTEAPDLAALQKELSDSTPLILVSNAGSDPTFMCEALANSLDVPLRVAVMGSATGIDLAERYLTDAMADGTWVLLKNMHLARAYADAVEKRLHRARSEGRLNRSFRLILSIEAAAKSDTIHQGGGGRCEDAVVELPLSLVEASIMLIFEPPPGMKSSLLQTVGALKPSSAQSNQPADIQRIYLAAAWLHAVVMERLLYIPMGWSRQYEFNDTDFWRVLQAVDNWVGSSKRGGDKNGSETIDRGSISWLALQTIIGTTLYGGKIGNEFDQLLLDSLCSQLMSDAVFDDDKLFALTDDAETNARLKCMSIQSLGDVQAWVRALPEAESPLWARLPASASRVISAQNAVATLERLASVRLIDEKEEEEDTSECNGDDQKENYAQQDVLRSIGETQWGQKIQRFSSYWCESLKDLASTTAATQESALATSHNDMEPTEMAIQREYNFALDRVGEILDELRALKAICTGMRKPTAAQRVLMDQLLKDQVPPRWARSYETCLTTVGEWMDDFRRRVVHVKLLHGAVERREFERSCLSLGLLFWPGAFLTATKQQAARRQHLSLEQLKLRLQLMSEDATRAHATASNGDDNDDSNDADEKKNSARPVWHVVGLTLHSACVQDDSGSCELLPAASSTSTTLVGALLQWELIAAPAVGDAAVPVSKSSPLMRLAAQNPASGYLATPFYVSPRRDVMLGVVEVAADPVKAPMRAWYERGVCLVAWSLVEC